MAFINLDTLLLRALACLKKQENKRDDQERNRVSRAEEAFGTNLTEENHNKYNCKS